MHTSYTDMKRKTLTNKGSQNILVHVVNMYDTSKDKFGFLCCHILHLPDIRMYMLAVIYLPQITEWHENIWKASLLDAHSFLSVQFSAATI